MNSADHKALKQKYLECFGVRTTNMTAWQEAVRDLTDQGISRATLVEWAAAAGYSRGYVSSLLSRIFCSLGLRKRGAGAGRKPSLDTLELLAYARNCYGERFLKVLRAAWRAGKAQVVVDIPRESLHRAGMNANVAPQLAQRMNSIKPRAKTLEIRPERERRQSLSEIFTRNVNKTKTVRTKNHHQQL